MDNSYPEILQNLKTKPGASEDEITKMLHALGTNLPAEYLDLLRRSNGAHGTGPNLFVIIDPAEEVPGNTVGYGAPEFAPGLVIIGSDGCGNLLGIDTRTGDPATMRFVWVDPYEMDWKTMRHSEDSLLGLLEYLDLHYARLLASDD